MKDSVLYSVIIPTYNRGHLINHAIESILEQGYETIEIIVIDDGSTDNTKEIVKKYGTKGTYQYQHNQGTSAARNEGVKIASGKYISFLDSDDLFLPGKMEREQEVFAQFPEAEVIVTDAEYYNDNKKISASWMKFKGLEIHGKDPRYMDANQLNWTTGSLFATCNITLQRSVIPKLGKLLFDTSLERGQDWDLEIRIIRYCKLLIDPFLTCQVHRFERKKLMGDWREYGSEANLKYQRSLLLDKKIFTKAMGYGPWPYSIGNSIDHKLMEVDAALLRYARK